MVIVLINELSVKKIIASFEEYRIDCQRRMGLLLENYKERGKYEKKHNWNAAFNFPEMQISEHEYWKRTMVQEYDLVMFMNSIKAEMCCCYKRSKCHIEV